jgi:hypothetical protein
LVDVQFYLRYRKVKLLELLIGMAVLAIFVYFLLQPAPRGASPGGGAALSPMQQAAMTGDVSACDSLAANERDSCRSTASDVGKYQRAVAANDKALCAGISDSVIRDACEQLLTGGIKAAEGTP